MTEAMTDMPDIIIRTPFNRLTDAGTFVVMAELPHPDGGTRLQLLEGEPKMPPDKLWVLRDEESAVAWSALRVKELSSEGTEVYSHLDGAILRRFPDERLSRPLEYLRGKGQRRMLEW